MADQNTLNPTAPPPVANSETSNTAVQESDKEFVTVFIISAAVFLIGITGIDRMYVGKIGTGILKLITFGGLGIWTGIDFILLGQGKFTDKHNLPLKGYSNQSDWAKAVGLILGILYFMFAAFIILFFIIILGIAILAPSGS